MTRSSKFRHISSLLAALALAAGSLTLFSPPAQAVPDIHVSTQQELVDGVAAAQTSGQPAEIVFDNDILVDQTVVVPSGTTVTFTSSYKLEMTTDGTTISVEPGASLTIDGIDVTADPTTTGTGIVVGGDLVLASGTVTNHTSDDNGGGVIVNGAGTFTMTGGEIFGNSAVNNGGGVYSAGAGATFDLSGGTIFGNSAGQSGGGVCNTLESTFTMSGGEITGNDAQQYYGGGVTNTEQANFYLSGGKIDSNTTALLGGAGVFNNTAATFTMTGGDIFDNHVGTSYVSGTAPNGGGVYNGSTGIFYMSAGNVYNNTGVSGGGVFNGGGTSSGIFKMSGGTITGNRASYPGGGVYNGGVFTMTDGDISGNTGAVQGGGVFNGASMIMSGGSITDNTSPNGGGILDTVTATSLVIGGSAVVARNTYPSGDANNIALSTGVFITLGDGNNAADAPTTMSVGVTKSGDNGVVVASGASATDTAYFVSDTPGLSALFDSGQIKLAYGVAGALTSTDTLVPWSGNGGYDATHYDIDLTYHPAVGASPYWIEATTTINATVTGPDLGSFGLDLLGLDVSSVTVNGNAATFARVQDPTTNMYKLVVTPATAVSGNFTVAVTYSGTPQQFTFVGSYNFAVGWLPDSTSDGGGVGLGEPVGAFAWYPVNATPSDKASYTTHLTAPNAFSAVAIGSLVSTTAVGPDQTRWTWDEPDAVPSSFTIAAIGNYQFDTDTHTTPGGTVVPIDAYTDPGLTNGGQVPAHYIDLTKQLLDWGEAYFGPYQPAVAGYIMKPISVSYALEVYGKPFYTADWGDATYIHEFAHQWGGNSVSVADWSDLWLAEGFATYVPWLWNEDHGGASVNDQALAVYDLPDTNPLWSVAPAGMTSQSQMFGNWNYDGGALALAALRQGIGPDLMQQVMYDWFTQNAGGNVSTQDFIALAESVSGADLTQWADDYLFNAGKPPAWPAALSYLPPPALVDLGSATVTVGSAAYTDAALTPTVTVSLGGASLVEGQDYTATYANNTNVGTATVTVAGIGNYTGTANGQFTISARVITFSIDAIPDQAYTGAPITPSVVVRDGATTVPTQDYTVSYANNTDAGTASVSVTGIGNYAGSTGAMSFGITATAPPAQDQTLVFDSTNVAKTFGDPAFTNPLTHVGGGALSFASTDPTVASVDSAGQVTILAAGSTSITVMAAAVPGQWLEDSASYALTIAPLPELSLATITWAPPADASNTTVAVSTNQTGLAASSDQSWLTATVSGASISLSADANPSGSPRTATVTVQAGGLQQTLTVSQAGVTVPASGGGSAPAQTSPSVTVQTGGSLAPDLGPWTIAMAIAAVAGLSILWNLRRYRRGMPV